MAVYIVRHGEVEHHQSDIEITARGREQARAAALILASYSNVANSLVYIFHSPVLRVVETAQLIAETLETVLRPWPARIFPPQPDGALENVRFISDAARGLQEPSLLYAEMNTPEFLQTVSPARAEFFRGFWTSDDPMGYWLTHDSDGGAETPAAVLERLRARLREIFSKYDARENFVLVTHSGAMRVLLQDVFDADLGEPDFCGIIAITPTNQPQRVQFNYREQVTDYALF